MTNKNNLSAYIGVFSESEIELSRALGSCSFPPGTNQKRFAQNMAGYTGLVTERQRWYLYKMVVRYRRQIAPHLVARAILWLAENPEPLKHAVAKPLVSRSSDNFQRKMLATVIESKIQQLDLFIHKTE
jgi:hypothetical protein